MTQEELNKALEKLYRDSSALEKHADLYSRAAVESELAYVPKNDALRSNAEGQMTRLTGQRATVDKETQTTVDALRALYNEERQKLSNQTLQRGLARSSIAMNLQEGVGQRETAAVGGALASAEERKNALDAEARRVMADMEKALLGNDYQKALDTRARFDKLVAEYNALEEAARQTAYKQAQDEKQFNYKVEQDQKQYDYKAAQDALLHEYRVAQDAYKAEQDQKQFDYKAAQDALAQQLAREQFDYKQQADVAGRAQKAAAAAQTAARQSAGSANTAAKLQLDREKEANRHTEKMWELEARCPGSVVSEDLAAEAPALSAKDINDIYKTLSQCIATCEDQELGALFTRVRSQAYVDLLGEARSKQLETAAMAEILRREQAATAAALRDRP